jgi:predicted O-methyltransferase YrrM
MDSLCGGCTIQDNEVCVVCKSLPTLKLDDAFEQDLIVVKQIDGCLFPGEEAFLAQLAKQCTGSGVIVELGSYLGRSTASLAIGSRLGSNVKVYTFDSYEGDSAMETHSGMFQDMKNNLHKAGVVDQVVAALDKTHFPPDSFNEPVELLFIDADHEPIATKRDFEAWEPKVIVGGKIAFHDTYDIVQGGVRFVGPLKVIGECCYDNPGFKLLGRFQSITVVEKQEAKPEAVYKKAPKIVTAKQKTSKTSTKK